MPELLGLPYTCLTCGGQLEIAASNNTKKKRKNWLCNCTPVILDWFRAVEIPRGEDDVSSMPQ